MIEPTDQDIAEALQAAGFAKPDKHEIEAMRDEHKHHGSWSFVFAHARCIEKLRVAVEALESIASWREGAVVSGLFDEPGSAQAARDALTQIKEGGNG